MRGQTGVGIADDELTVDDGAGGRCEDIDTVFVLVLVLGLLWRLMVSMLGHVGMVWNGEDGRTIEPLANIRQIIILRIYFSDANVGCGRMCVRSCQGVLAVHVVDHRVSSYRLIQRSQLPLFCSIRVVEPRRKS